MNFPINTPLGFSPVVFVFIYVWSLFWKGLALWSSSKNNQKNWFVVLLILNTVGILEIIYLFFFAKKKLTLQEMKSWISKE